MRISHLAIFTALLASAAVAVSQTVENGTLRVNTRLVEISVVARDKNGPVADLRKEDFTILDNGKPQRVDLFVLSDARNEKQVSLGARRASLPTSGMRRERFQRVPL